MTSSDQQSHSQPEAEKVDPDSAGGHVKPQTTKVDEITHETERQSANPAVEVAPVEPGVGQDGTESHDNAAPPILSGSCRQLSCIGRVVDWYCDVCGSPGAEGAITRGELGDHQGSRASATVAPAERPSSSGSSAVEPLTGLGAKTKRSPVQRKSNEVRHFRAWVGSQSELRRIHDVIERQSSKRGVQIEVKLGTKSIEVAGPYDEVMLEFDRRTWDSIEFSGGRRYIDDERISLKMDRRSELLGRPITLNIESVEPDWAAQAMAQVSAEVDNGRPRWSALYSVAGISIAQSVVILLPLVILAIRMVGPVGAQNIIGPIVAAIFLLFAVVGVGTFSVKLLLGIAPPVEVYPEGGKSAAGQRLVYLLTGVVLPWLIPLIIVSLFSG